MHSSVRVVFDPTVLAIYAALEPETVAVGELMRSVSENDGTVGIPAVTYLEAYRGCSTHAQRERLGRLVNNLRSHVTMIDLAGDDAHKVAADWPSLSLGTSHVIHASTYFDAWIATYDAGNLTGIVPEYRLLDMKITAGAHEGGVSARLRRAAGARAPTGS